MKSPFEERGIRDTDTLLPTKSSAIKKATLKRAQTKTATYKSAPNGELKKAQAQSPAAMAQNDLVVPQRGQGYPVHRRKLHGLKGMISSGTKRDKLRTSTAPRTITKRPADKPSVKALLRRLLLDKPSI